MNAWPHCVPPYVEILAAVTKHAREKYADEVLCTASSVSDDSKQEEDEEEEKADEEEEGIIHHLLPDWDEHCEGTLRHLRRTVLKSEAYARRYQNALGTRRKASVQ